jgi:hypothetical protein
MMAVFQMVLFTQCSKGLLWCLGGMLCLHLQGDSLIQVDVQTHEGVHGDHAAPKHKLGDGFSVSRQWNLVCSLKERGHQPFPKNGRALPSSDNSTVLQYQYI